MAEQKDLHSWLMSLLSFEVKVLTALTEEKQRLAVLEKKLFLLENGLDVDLPQMALKDICAFTDEQRKSKQGNISQLIHRRCQFYFCDSSRFNLDENVDSLKKKRDIFEFCDGIQYFKKQSENHVQEKKKYPPHA